MDINVQIAKILMNLMPNKPTYNASFFVQELFRHPEYLNLSDQEKNNLMIEWVEKAIVRASMKPFDQYYENILINDYLKDQRILDLGCSIGGKTFYMAERYRVKSMYGIDVDENSVQAARLFSCYKSELKANYNFRCSYAEDLPFEDDFFDGIISHDTIEHVRDVKQSIKECHRVTKKGGHLFLVFPSYFLPIGGAHLSSVTRTPFLEWFFSPKTLNLAYKQIISQWNDSYNWYKHESDDNYGNWEVVEGGIGVNGMTYKQFYDIVNEIGFSDINFIKVPLLKVSFLANRHPIIKKISNLMQPLLRIESLIDYLSHRLVFILKV